MEVFRKVVVLAALAVLCQAVKDYTGYKVIQATPSTSAHVTFLHETEGTHLWMDFWKLGRKIREPAQIMVSGDDTEAALTLFRDAGLEATVLHENVQDLIDLEKEQMTARSQEVGPEPKIDFNNYNRFAEIETWLTSTAQSCGSLCELTTIGQSFEGRNLYVMQIKSGRKIPIIYLECGIHAREWIAPAVCLNIINKMITEHSSNPEVQNMINQYDWYIEPSSNPDGYEYCHTNDRMWRKTRSTNSGSSCRGTDPNRNFSYMWGGLGTSSNPCSNLFRGRSAFDQSETNAINTFLQPLASRVRAYNSVHSYGQYILIPWGYDLVFVPDHDDLQSVADTANAAIFTTHGARYTADNSALLLGATAGASDDWAKGALGIKFAYTYELRDTGFYGFELPPSQIQPTFEEIFNSFVAMANDLNSRFPMEV